MYRESQPKVENESLLKAFKKFFGMCSNVNIILLPAEYNDNVHAFQNYSLHLANHPSQSLNCAYDNTVQLQNVCKNMGDAMKQSLLTKCKNYPVKETLAKGISGSHIIFDQCYRHRDHVGLIGDKETFCSILERMSKVDYRNGQYYYNCENLNGSNFIPVDKEEDLYLFKGHPTFYLKSKIRKRYRQDDYISYNEVLFGFYLEASNIEVYKV